LTNRRPILTAGLGVSGLTMIVKIAEAGLGTHKGARVERTKLKKAPRPGVLVEQGA